MQKFHVDPWKVEGEVDYDQLVKKFGINYIDDKLLDRLQKHVKKLHYLLTRNIYFANRDLNWILDEYEKGNKFYIYTGIAPSGSMTLAHLIPFIFTQWLQKEFDAEVYIQIPDEEKYLAKKNIDLETIHRLAYEDALHIISLGFDKSKTKIFFDTEYANTLYKQAVRVAKHITFSNVKDAFGMTNETNIGWIFYTSMQAVPAFLKSVEEKHNVPCLIPLAVDQDVHFRIARDAIAKLGYYKPAVIHAKFLPALNGAQKMSASDPLNTIYLNDDEETVNKKIQKAFTGQQPTLELQKKYGGNPDKCVVCQYYKYLFETDDDKLRQIFEAERNGTLFAGEHKKDLANRINIFLKGHREKMKQNKDKLNEYILR